MLLESPLPPLDQTKQDHLPQALTMLAVPYQTHPIFSQHFSSLGSQNWTLLYLALAQIQSPVHSLALSLSGAQKQAAAG